MRRIPRDSRVNRESPAPRAARRAARAPGRISEPSPAPVTTSVDDAAALEPSGPPRVPVRAADAGDLGFAAMLHEAALPHGFFARLGERFLRRYYRTFLESPHAVALVAVTNDGRAGVLVGTVHNRAHYRWLRRHAGRRLALAGAAALLVRPRVALAFVRHRAARYLRAWRLLGPGSRAEPRTDHDAGDVAVLTHVSVLPEARRTGAGRALVDAFVAAAAAAGSREARLVTLSGEQGAAEFYSRLGWSHCGDGHLADGHRISSFRLDLDHQAC